MGRASWGRCQTEGSRVLGPFEQWKSPGAIAICSTEALYHSLEKYFWGLTASRAYACYFLSSRGGEKKKKPLWLPFQIEIICAGFSSPLCSRSSPCDSNRCGCGSELGPSAPPALLVMPGVMSRPGGSWVSLGHPPVAGRLRVSPGAAGPSLPCELSGSSG